MQEGLNTEGNTGIFTKHCLYCKFQIPPKIMTVHVIMNAITFLIVNCTPILSKVITHTYHLIYTNIVMLVMYTQYVYCVYCPCV